MIGEVNRSWFLLVSAYGDDEKGSHRLMFLFMLRKLAELSVINGVVILEHISKSISSCHLAMM